MRWPWQRDRLDLSGIYSLEIDRTAREITLTFGDEGDLERAWGALIVTGLTPVQQREAVQAGKIRLRSRG